MPNNLKKVVFFCNFHAHCSIDKTHHKNAPKYAVYDRRPFQILRAVLEFIFDEMSLVVDCIFWSGFVVRFIDTTVSMKIAKKTTFFKILSNYNSVFCQPKFVLNLAQILFGKTTEFYVKLWDVEEGWFWTKVLFWANFGVL